MNSQLHQLPMAKLTRKFITNTFRACISFPNLKAKCLVFAALSIFNLKSIQMSAGLVGHLGSSRFLLAACLSIICTKI